MIGQSDSPAAINTKLSPWTIRWLSKLPKAPFVVLAFFLALSCLNGRARLLELTTHFKLQYFAGSVLFVLLYALLREWRWCMAALLCVGLSGSSLVAYWQPRTAIAAARSERKLRLLLANVFYENDRYADLLELVRQAEPDLVFLQEFTGEWEEGTAGLRQTYPDGMADTQGGVGGVAAYSRLAGAQAESLEIGNFISPSLLLKVPLGTKTLSLVTTHPPIPSAEQFGERNEQLRLLAEQVSRLPEPRVVISDLNTTMWSPYFRDLLARAKLKDAREGFGILPTYPQYWYLWPFQIPLDHCLVSAGIRIVAVRTGRDFGSDHLPLIVDLAVAE